MKRAVAAFCISFVFGCGDDLFKPPDFSARDFSPNDTAVTLEEDLAMMPALDMAVPGPDFTVPRDLAQATCDLGPAGGDAGSGGRLVLAVVGAGKALHVAKYDPVSFWSTYQVDSTAALADVVLARTGPMGLPLLVGRRTNDALDWAQWAPCTDGFHMLQPLSVTSSHRPALVSGAMSDLVFKGSISSDARLYHSAFDGVSWSAPAMQATFLTNVGPAAVRLNSALHAVFKSHNGTALYDGVIGGAATSLSADSDSPPAAVVTLAGKLIVAFTGTNKNVYWLEAGGAAAKICPDGVCLATSNHGPLLALDATGSPIVAFRGEDDRVYTSTLTGTTWSAPIQASEGGETTAHAPALAAGVGAATAELVYVRNGDGYVRHARLSAGAWGAWSTLSATPVEAAPALLALP